MRSIIYIMVSTIAASAFGLALAEFIQRGWFDSIFKFDAAQFAGAVGLLVVVLAISSAIHTEKN